MQPVALHIPGYTLSAPTEADIDRITEVCQDPEVQRWTTIPVPYARANAEGFVRDMVARGWDNGTDCVWAIRPDAGPLVGMVGLHGIVGGSAILGYWLAPEARGKGVATAACRAVIDFGFGPLGLTRVAWDAVVGNQASRRVAEKCGFRIEGEIRGHYFVRGVREDGWLGTLYITDPKPW